MLSLRWLAHGEQEVVRVANDAIGRVRKLYAPSPGASEETKRY
jgi:hypothetical protein